jgi:hypothetical protein
MPLRGLYTAFGTHGVCTAHDTKRPGLWSLYWSLYEYIVGRPCNSLLQETLFLPDSPWYDLWESSYGLFLIKTL